ncbi:MAG: hypothetical protein ABI091_17370 [Ferruginibacter sp.]
MRVVIILFAFFISIKLFAQDSSNTSIKLDQIETIPCSYIKYEALGRKFYDQAFDFILSQDTFAIPSLINLLTDTSVSKVKNLDANNYYKKGDLAFILINYIEGVPFALITHSQWCICCDCGNLPKDFLQYVDRNRFQFQKEYQSYYVSKERRKMIKEITKGKEKKKNH